jgi:hypothetical protein
VIINCVTTGFARDTFDNLRNGYNKLEGDHGRIFFMDAALFYPDDEGYLLSETNNSSEDIEDPGDAGPSDHGAHLYDWLSIVHDSEVTRMKEAVRVPSLNILLVPCKNFTQIAI